VDSYNPKGWLKSLDSRYNPKHLRRLTVFYNAG
jgi:hypothetical protein